MHKEVQCNCVQTLCQIFEVNSSSSYIAYIRLSLWSSLLKIFSSAGTPESEYDVVVVGGGHNGLVAAR